jgi:hypothetical protein
VRRWYDTFGRDFSVRGRKRTLGTREGFFGIHAIHAQIAGNQPHLNHLPFQVTSLRRSHCKITGETPMTPHGPPQIQMEQTSSSVFRPIRQLEVAA